MKLPAKRLDQSAISDRFDAMRKEHGIGKKRVLQFQCSTTGLLFAINFHRASDSECFKIETIEAVAPQGGGLFGKFFGKGEAAPQSFSAKEFNFAGFRCPHCKHSAKAQIAHFFECGCGKLQCGSTIELRDSGSRMATCARPCGQTGVLDSVISSFDGSNANAARGKPALTGPQAAKRLSAPMKRLPRK